MENKPDLTSVHAAGAAIEAAFEHVPSNGQRNHKAAPKVTSTFDSSDESPDESDLDTSAKPALANLNNAVRVIEKDPSFCPVWFDEFLQRILTGDPPREWTDKDDIHLTLQFQREKGILKMSRETVAQAVIEIASRSIRNCVKDWLDHLEWDGVPHIDDFFSDHFGAAGSEYIRTAGHNFWLSMVARVYRPGCQADHMIVLEGGQGIGKSSALRIIGGSWFCEQHENVTHKDFYENLQGKLLVEISEMDSFNRSEVAKVKAVTTTTTDRYRESYGRRAADHPRQCIFAGTTNSDSWNGDVTGARRFWPITCTGEIDTKAIAINRCQLFAEAVLRYKAGESWHQMPAAETRSEQKKRYVEPAWTPLIQRYIEQERDLGCGTAVIWKVRANPLPDVSVTEVLEHALDIPKAQWTKSNEMRVAEALKYMEWKKRDVRRNGSVVKRWFPLPPEGSDAD